MPKPSVKVYLDAGDPAVDNYNSTVVVRDHLVR
jgi:hypothetical protein